MSGKPTTLPELIAALEASVQDIAPWDDAAQQEHADLMECAARVLRVVEGGPPRMSLALGMAINRAIGEPDAG